MPEHELKELLPETLYDNIKLAFDDENLREVLKQKSKSSTKDKILKQRKARKRNYKEASLQCNEKISWVNKPENLEKVSKNKLCQKKTNKIKDKMAYFRKSEKENYSNHMKSPSNFGMNNMHAPTSNWNTPKQHKRHKTGLNTSGFKNNILFDSCDNKSSLSLSCSGDQIEPVSFTPFKSNYSPNKNLTKNNQMEEMQNTPLQDRFEKFGLPNPDSTHWRSVKYFNGRNTPLCKEFRKVLNKETPKKDFEIANDNNPFINDYNFESPKKELSFGREIVSSTPVNKTPISKQVYDLPCQPSDLFEDDATKAEFSNLFSNKSNHISNM